LADVKSNYNVSDSTLLSYIDVLESLFVIRDIDAWTPQIRSKTAIRAAKKHIFIDPSIGLAALGVAPDYFYNDLDLFAHVFENLVLRDLLVYAEACNARVMHYRDDFGLEADAVFQLEDGRYALIEVKTGANSIPEAEKNLLRFKDVIRQHNEKTLSDIDHPGVKYREPDLLLIICANAPMAFTTENGVKVVPIGCLKN
jgi:Predicted ATPase (AAA+ superfamily)